jgi:hypothetical protein
MEENNLIDRRPAEGHVGLPQDKFHALTVLLRQNELAK